MAVACLCLCLVRPTAGSQNEMVIVTGLVCLWWLVPCRQTSVCPMQVCSHSHDVAQEKQTLNYLKAMCDLT